MSVQQTVKTQQGIHQRASQGRLDNMLEKLRHSAMQQVDTGDADKRALTKKTARPFSAHEKKQYPYTSQPLRQNTAAHKHSSSTKDVLIGLLLHLSTLAAPPDDFVLPACTVACARNPAGQRPPQRHPKTAPAFQI